MSGGADTNQRMLDRLQAVFRRVFDSEDLSVSESTALAEVPGWDRMRHLDLLAAIERAFGVRFTTREASQTGNTGSTVASIMEILVRQQDSTSTSLRASLQEAVSELQRRRILETWVRDQVAAVLNVPPSEVVAARVFQELGMTSLATVELASRLETGLGIELAPTLAFNFPSLVQLVPYLADRLQSSGNPDG